MRSTFNSVLIVLLLLPCLNFAQYAGYTLDWSDEFSGSGLNTNIWNYDLGDGCPNCGWGNSEEQIYTMDRATVANGELTINAAWDPQDNRIESARLTTAGKRTWNLGILEARIKFVNFDPADHNFAAFWGLGESYKDPNIHPLKFDGGSEWPSCGEIDVMEAITNLNLSGVIHYNSWKDRNRDGLHDRTRARFISTNSGFIPSWDQYHVFGVEKTATQLIYMFDGVPFGTQDITGDEKLELNQPFHVILNVAIGGILAGDPPNPEDVDVSMVVDYVRYYTPNANRLHGAGTALQTDGRMEHNGSAKSSMVLDNPREEFGVFPNPAESRVSIEGIPHAAQSIEIVQVVSGQVMQRIPVNGNQNMELSLEHLSKGVYFIQTQSEGEMKVVKLVKY